MKKFLPLSKSSKTCLSRKTDPVKHISHTSCHWLLLDCSVYYKQRKSSIQEIGLKSHFW